MALGSREVAGMLVRLAASTEMPLSNMKIHKVMYFAHGHSLSLRGEPLIREPARAHRFGALYQKVYDALVIFGSEDLIGLRRHGPRKALRCLDYVPARCEAAPSDWELVQAVWNNYGPLSDLRVHELFHVAGTPWEEIRTRFPDRDDIVIPDELTTAYFQGKRSQGAAVPR